MNFLHLFAKPFIGVATAASLGLGGGAALHHSAAVQDKSDTKAHVMLSAEAGKDKGQHATSTKMTPDLFIGAKGAVHLVGAKVTAVASNSISAAVAWGSTSFPFSIHTTDSTTVKAKGDAIDVSDVRVGDTVNVSGTLDTDASAPTVDATLVRDVSLK